MTVTAVVDHAINMVEECRGTVECDCREQVCPESMEQLSSGIHTKDKRRNVQTLLHMCEHVKVFFPSMIHSKASNEADGWAGNGLMGAVRD